MSSAYEQSRFRFVASSRLAEDLKISATSTSFTPGNISLRVISNLLCSDLHIWKGNNFGETYISRYLPQCNWVQAHQHLKANKKITDHGE